MILKVIDFITKTHIIQWLMLLILIYRVAILEIRIDKLEGKDK